MPLEGLAGGGQLDLVAQDVVADELEPAGEALDLLGRGRQAERRGRQIDDASVERALFDLRNAGGMSEHDFEATLRFRPPVTGFDVERPLVVEGPRPLLIRQE